MQPVLWTTSRDSRRARIGSPRARPKWGVPPNQYRNADCAKDFSSGSDGVAKANWLRRAALASTAAGLVWDRVADFGCENVEPQHSR
jgi:hypothetical protein